jgi:chromosome segregation ATPase
MTQPKPPGPREWWIDELDREAIVMAAVPLSSAGVPHGAIHVIEKSYADKLEAELREAKAEVEQQKHECEIYYKQSNIFFEDTQKLKAELAELHSKLNNYVTFTDNRLADLKTERDQALSMCEQLAERVDAFLQCHGKSEETPVTLRRLHEAYAAFKARGENE